MFVLLGTDDNGDSLLFLVKRSQYWRDIPLNVEIIVFKLSLVICSYFHRQRTANDAPL